MNHSSQRQAVQTEIDNLETFEKHGESYANADGRHGWRNPIRSDTGPLIEAIVMANSPKRILEIGSSPHISSGASVDVIMRNVFMALLPVCVFAIYAFGMAAALILVTATVSFATRAM